MRFKFLYLFLIIALEVIPKVTFSQVSTDSTTVSTIPDWIYLASDDRDNKYYIRSNYVSKMNSEIKIWIKIVFLSTTVKKKVYKNAVDKQLIDFDCYNKKFNLISYVEYSSTGNIIDQADFNGDISFEDVVPDSVMEYMLGKICETFSN